MSSPFLRYILGKLQRGVITFINMVTLANRDYPYHDYETGATAVLDKPYVVGENNQLQTQKKLFISKCTAIMCTEDAHVHFNSAQNVLIALVADTWYTFTTNIYAIYYGRGVGDAAGVMHIHCAGVLPQEARTPRGG